MLFQSNGIVLQSIQYGENSLINKVLSKEKGLITLLSNKSKSKKNKQGNFFQPLSAIAFVCYLSSKSTIHRIKEVSYNNVVPMSPESVSINAIRFFISEFLSKVIKEEEQNLSLYLFVENKIRVLNSTPSIYPYFHVSFLLELMVVLGIQPFIEPDHLFFDMEEGAGTHNKPRHGNYIEQKDIKLYLKGVDSPESLSKKERKTLLNILLSYYSIQLGGQLNIKSKAVLEVIFS